jgi:hypothetical protein
MVMYGCMVDDGFLGSCRLPDKVIWAWSTVFYNIWGVKRDNALLIMHYMNITDVVPAVEELCIKYRAKLHVSNVSILRLIFSINNKPVNPRCNS